MRSEVGLMRISRLAGIVLAGILLFALAGAGAFAYADDGSGAGSAASGAQLTTSAKDKVAKPAKKQLKAFKKASADFSLELFGRCVAAKGKNANVTVAPMSVMNALAVTANGAKGATAKQMRKVLGDGASISAINANLAWYNSQLANTAKARISNANAIWYSDDGVLKMRKAFLKAAKRYYKAQVTAADFGDPATVDAINAWVAEKTEGMIKRVVDRLDPDERIAIVNALYFDAKWKRSFDASDTHEATFTTASGKKRTVQMMHSTEDAYIEGLGAVGFIKPYAKGYSYVALLPEKGVSLKKFVRKLDGDAFRSLIAGATSAKVRVAMPKYSLSYSNDDMSAQLAAMGMPIAFTEGADFTKMATNGDRGLCIGRVVHKTKIDVDELGTKAAAVTGVFMKDAAVAPDLDVKYVTLNRPFVYAIIDNATKLPVFIGTVNDPK